MRSPSPRLSSASLVKYSTYLEHIDIPESSDIVRWNSVISFYLNSGRPSHVIRLFHQILRSSAKPNHLTFSILIKACTSSLFIGADDQPQKVHTHLLKTGICRFTYVGTALLDLYAKSGNILDAQKLFDEIPHRDRVAWNALICGYSHRGYDLCALEQFSRMLEEGFLPCPTTLISVIPSCARPALLPQGKCVHVFGIKCGLSLDSRVINALTAMYGKCLDIGAANFLFERMVEKCVISWNTMISVCSQIGCMSEASVFFNRMRVENVAPNSVSIITLLSSGPVPFEPIHCFTVKSGLATDASVNISLIHMYAKTGYLRAAMSLYDSMPEKSLVSLTSIISSYIEKGDVFSAVESFCSAILLEMKPDAVTVGSVLQGITSKTYYTVGVCLHGYAVKNGLHLDALVFNGLINMYKKIDDVEAAFSLFREVETKELTCWNSMISCFIQMGKLYEAMALFLQMKLHGNAPDSNTLASLLSGAAQHRSLQLGRFLHAFILRNNVDMEAFVQTALLDMYAKCGSITNAARAFESVEDPCLATWNAMILACAFNGLESQAIEHLYRMVEGGFRPDEITFLGVLSACSHAGLVEEGWEFFNLMRYRFALCPGLEHYACMVDLLGRAGLLDEAVTLVKGMEIAPDSTVLEALLGACCTHRHVELGECVAKQLLLIDQYNYGFYLLMSNLYAASGRWDDVARVRRIIYDSGGDGWSGTSSIEVSSLYFLQKMDSDLCLYLTSL